MESTKLAWLAGIIDGEGSIACYVQNCKVAQVLHSCIAITNGDPDIIMESNRIVSEILGRPVKNYPKTKNSVNYLTFQIQIQSRKEIIKLLTLISPYLVGKKAQAQLMIDILRKHAPMTPISKVERQAIEVLKKMKYINLIPVNGNAELKSNSDSFVFDKCVEDIEATTQSEMNMS